LVTFSRSTADTVTGHVPCLAGATLIRPDRIPQLERAARTQTNTRSSTATVPAPSNAVGARPRLAGRGQADTWRSSPPACADVAGEAEHPTASTAKTRPTAAKCTTSGQYLLARVSHSTVLLAGLSRKIFSSHNQMRRRGATHTCGTNRGTGRSASDQRRWQQSSRYLKLPLPDSQHSAQRIVSAHSETVEPQRTPCATRAV
jgi:hypothetical protein